MSFNSRQEYNLKILDKIKEYILKNPELRFIQILWALNIINRKEGTFDIEDRFHEEPSMTFYKIFN